MLRFIRIDGQLLFLRMLEKKDLVHLLQGHRVETPQWKSHLGLDGWTETASKHLGIQKELARCLLLYHEEQQRVIEYRHDKDVISAAADINPFLEEGNLSFADILEWRKNFPFLWKVNYMVVRVFKRYFVPANLYQFNKAVVAYDVYHPERMADFARLQMWRQSDEDLKLWKKYGEISGKIRSLYNKNSSILYTAKELDVIHMLDMKYMHSDVSNVYIRDLVRAGIPATKIWHGCSKKEGHKLLQMYSNDRPYNHGNQEAIHDVCRLRYSGMPEAWFQYLNSVLQADWAWNKRRHLERTRVVHGPAGQTATLHYHQLLGEVTDDMLVNGARTSWKRVMARLEVLAQARIQAQLGNNVKLPTLKLPAGSKLVPLDTSHKLRDEGNEMKHCVGGYIHSCLEGKSYIYHYGDPAPNGCTLEVTINIKNRPMLQQTYIYKDKKVDFETRHSIEQEVNNIHYK